MGRQLFMFALGVRLEYDCSLSRVARGSFRIGRVNVVTSVPVMVPSPCTGSEASRVRTGQWGSPIGSWVFDCEFLRS
ncbi:hypothetical protein TNCV_5054611 [Trichonephila clavipes]|nr:hypothetical protein TNCV_5054611 [Trichonephila clavipes]